MSLIDYAKAKIKFLLRPTYYFYWQTSYKGNKYACPICGNSADKFMPHGIIKRANAECPYCHSLERHRLQWIYMKDKTNLFKKKLSILHFAPEAAFSSKLLSLKNINYLSCDLYDKKVMLKADITNLPFKDNSFDVVLCNHVLEHIVNDSLAMSEVFRILKKDGWAILQVPIDYKRKFTFEDPTVVSPSERLKLFGQEDHVRIYGSDYKDKLKTAGFKVEVKDFAKTLAPQLISKYLLDEDELIYYCTK